MEAYRQFLDQLVAHRHLIPSGVRGLYGRGAQFEDVIERFDRYVVRMGADQGAERLRFPPLMTRSQLETSEYLKSFPDLVGVVHAFQGKERDHVALIDKLEKREPAWSASFPHTDVVMLPAACYPLYAMMAGSKLPAGGRVFDVLGTCFRHEPSDDPARMQSFRMHEYVRTGKPEDCLAFRELWKERGTRMLRALGLDAKVDLANDPFFGRAGKMLAANQRDQNLKFELLVAICSEEKPTAIMSFNYHQDHFGHLFHIEQEDGARAHTACVGFGLERIALALYKTHGMDAARWPQATRELLELP